MLRPDPVNPPRLLRDPEDDYLVALALMVSEHGSLIALIMLLLIGAPWTTKHERDRTIRG